MPLAIPSTAQPMQPMIMPNTESTRTAIAGPLVVENRLQTEAIMPRGTAILG